MKKCRNLVIGGIESKTVALVLISMVLVAVVFVTSMLTQSSMLTRLTQETSERQLASITGTTENVIHTMIVENMDRQTELEARVANELFHDRAVGVQTLGDYVTKLLSNREMVLPAAWQRPDVSREGEMTVKALFAQGMEASDAAASLGVIANAADMMLSICAAYGTDNIWFTVPEGATLMADTVPSNWIDADGAYVPYNACDRYWYRQAVEAGELVFSDAEYDYRTGRLCVTCAMPVYDVEGALLGVAGADIFLDDMQKAIQKSGESGVILGIVNQNGHLIIAPAENGDFRVMNSAEAADLRDSEYEELAALVRDAMQGKTEVRLVHAVGQAYYAIGVPMETVGWTLLAAYSQADAERPVRQLEADYHAIQTGAVTAYRSQSTAGRTIVWIVLAAVLLAMLFGAYMMSKRIAKPLNTITRRISELSETNMEFTMEDAYRTGDEVENLAESFAMISHRTVEYLDTVRRVTAEKERIGAELSLATRIQAAMLPHRVPAFPDRRDFDIIGSMDPAKEVGGDFYDYFLIDDDHLGIVIADVSGKGVPAALFMMASKIILQSVAMLGGSPAEILTKTNQAICSNNEAQMFVTVWVGILELSTGKLTCSNAGHEYPVCKRPDGVFALYKDRHGFVIGGIEDAKYREYSLDLEPGTKLFVYTDGVPEATNAQQELFGTERMVAALNEAPDASPMDILKNVRRAVDSFVLDAEQFDDLTMVCLEYRGPNAADKEA
ncbi:MAG: SpoIIE family protein phosphatase [Clostridia bacterium]|nr:SpoIIE family protein phosphatase [Clostridia bacterium]